MSEREFSKRWGDRKPNSLRNPKHESKTKSESRYISFPCPNPECEERLKKMAEELIINRNTLQIVMTASDRYRRYVCACGTELRIPKKREQ